MDWAARVAGVLAITLGTAFCPAAAEPGRQGSGKLPGVRVSLPGTGIVGTLGAAALGSLPQVEALPKMPVAEAPVARVAPAVAGQAKQTALSALQSPHTFEVLDALAPGNIGKTSDDQSAWLGRKLIGSEHWNLGPTDARDPVQADDDGKKAAPLPKSRAEQAEDAGGSVELPTEKPPQLVPSRFSDYKHFARLWWQNMYFYIVNNIRAKYPEFVAHREKLIASGEVPAVSRPRLFFSHMRVMGQTGWFYIMGFAPLEDGPVAAEARASFRKYFDGPGVDEATVAAFDRFVDRARDYNKEKRAPSNYRKLLRDAMIKASTMPAAKIAPYLDSLYPEASTPVEYQGESAAALLKRFDEIVMEELRAQKPGKGKILAVILIGSYATGAATPKSDFDGEVVVENGDPSRVNEFVGKIIARWKAEGRQDRNPVTFHMFPFPLSRRVIRMVHDAPYIVFSPDPRIRYELAMHEGEPFAFQQQRQWRWWSHPLRQLQRWSVFATSFLPPPKKPSMAHGIPKQPK